MNRAHKKLYNKMKKMGFLDIKDHVRIENEPYMPLSIERLNWHGGEEAISICHYSKANGDLMRDPEMVVTINNGMVEPVYYRNDYAGLEQEVYKYDETGTKTHVRTSLKAQLNEFLNDWLRNIEGQEFQIRAST